MKKNKIIIDIEFTGLDNSIISNNEIIELKMKNLTNNKVFIKNYNSNKALSAYCQIQHKVKKYKGVLFSKEEMEKALNEIKAKRSDKFVGFGVSKDIEMLQKYDISLEIEDIRENLQRSKYDYRMATEGSGLEECYFLVTKKYPDLNNHVGIKELNIIEELYLKSFRLKKKLYLDIMPFGHCAGMDLSDYVQEYRRAADGYRYNNSDLLAKSLTHWIYVVEEIENEYNNYDYEYDED